MSMVSLATTTHQRSWLNAILVATFGVVASSHPVFSQAPPTVVAEKPSVLDVGVAKIDITPDYPIRLNGFGFRRDESAGVRHPIWAKALAIGSDADNPAVLIAVDNLGVPDELTQDVARRLKQKAGLEPERLAITATHTHTAPMLNGCAPTIFGVPIPPEHQAHIDRYTREFTDKLESVALAALKDRKSATLEWGIGTAKFAKNRRTKDGSGPVDHDLPVLVVRDVAGKPRAIYFNYACHCVTLSDNRIGGDWAGFAQDLIERQHPGAIALVSVGCGADQNPTSGVTGDKGDVAEGQGAEIAAEVQRLLASPLRPVRGPLVVKHERLELAFDQHPTRAEWEEKAKLTNAIGHHARVQLERLDRGEALRTQIGYPVQTWAFGDSLGMAFLPGEVVVDYSLRLKRELDGRRLWLNAYANASPCYIPSERVLKEGGYEGGGAMVYYDQPTKLAPGLEQKIVDAVKGQLAKKFSPPVDKDKAQGARPLPPEQSLGLLRTNPGLKVDLVAAEPLVASPVAIDFGPDGKLWVAEMADYPLGLDGQFQPGGRIRLLESTRDDGRFDTATVFLENIPFPTGVTVWRNGVLVCAAPDILYAEDTDGDRRADVVKKLFSGFGTENYQARVNSLEYGLDGWIHGSCGLFGGQITSFAGGEPLKLGDRDFRMQPDTGVMEPVTGRTQQGRVRDDWGNWFGCTNSNLCVHYPLADHYLRRNSFAAPPTTTVSVPEDAAANQLVPASDKLQLFKLSGANGRPTAACGLGIYRDDLLGDGYRGNAFTCEPVNLLVHRLQLSPRGSTFAGRRAPEEAQSEFLSSTDTWFRPVQARTGPDGALWIVDMYRYVIEHPRWIPAEDLANVDVRAGHDMGRIYRVRPKDEELRPWPRLDQFDTAGLVAALDSPNGWQRDMATQMLSWRADRSAIPLLHDLLATRSRAEARLHALCVLDVLNGLSPEAVRTALGDAHPGVRRHAVRLASSLAGWKSQCPVSEIARLVRDEDSQVRLQTACSLGDWDDPLAAFKLADVATAHADDPFLIAAVLSSLKPTNIADFIPAVFELSRPKPLPDPVFAKIVSNATAMGDGETITRVLHEVSTSKGTRWSAFAEFLSALKRRGEPIESLTGNATARLVTATLDRARTRAVDESTDESERLAAIGALGRRRSTRDADLAALSDLLTPRNSLTVQTAVVTALGRIADERAARALLDGWRGYSPAVRSQALDILLGREAWVRMLLQRIADGDVAAADLDLARRQRLLAHKDAGIRTQAETLFAGSINPARQNVLEAHRDALSLPGDRERGRSVFAKACAACHRLENAGHAIGPDLAALANKTPQFLLQEILDPNRNVDSRFIAYAAASNSGRTFNGLLATETATSITLRAQEGKEEVVLRADLDELVSTRKSLMPEGLEKDLTRQNLADVIAYLTPENLVPTVQPLSIAAVQAAPAFPKLDELAHQILDESRPRAEREALATANADSAAELIAAMTDDLPQDEKEEYRRIPWIWRVAVAAGKKNDAQVLRKLLAASLPHLGGPLRDWQAVVVGGGIINGVSLQDVWPKVRIDDLLKDQPDLRRRWEQALDQSAAMADNESVRTGTRYDALRMIALDAWDQRGPQLQKYLAKGVHNELQMGAISGLSDVDKPEVATLFLGGFAHYSEGNRKLALDALVRTEARIDALLDAIERGTIPRTALSEAQLTKVRRVKDPSLRERVRKLLPD
jgi:putative membrane-bound dehydrogenase-like protein